MDGCAEDWGDNGWVAGGLDDGERDDAVPRRRRGEQAFELVRGQLDLTRDAARLRSDGIHTLGSEAAGLGQILPQLLILPGQPGQALPGRLPLHSWAWSRLDAELPVEYHATDLR